MFKPHQPDSVRKRIRGIFRHSIITGITIIAFQAVTASAAGGWEWKNPLPTPFNVRSTSFASDLIGVAAGDGGTILTTAEGGFTWQQRDSGIGTDANFSRVHFVNSKTAIAVGGYPPLLGETAGIIVRTTDAGATWVTLATIPGALVFDVAFQNLSSGIAVGIDFTTFLPIILRTNDGWTTWTTQTLEPSGVLASVAFSQTNVATAMGFDGDTGKSLIVRTNDGGATWQQEQAPSDQTLNDVAFRDPQNGVAVGTTGTILTTSDGGVHWVPQVSGTDLNLHDISLVGVGLALIAGGNSDDMGIILSSSDSAVTWNSTSFGRSIEGIDFTASGRGVATGSSGQLLHTENGGQSWSEISQTVSTEGLL